jgi:uncharacterized protein YhaN
VSIDDFENKAKGLRAVLGAFQACSEDVCASCISFEAVVNQVSDELKKLRNNVQKSDASEEAKERFAKKIDRLSDIAKQIPLAPEVDCNKSIGVCKIPIACIPADLLLFVMSEEETPVKKALRMG